MKAVHVVAKGDTLGKIAQAHGKSVTELVHINSLKDPNHIRVGQRIALSREGALGVRALFLDRDRNPISNLDYKLVFNGKEFAGTTLNSGLTVAQFTERVTDEVRILVKRTTGEWHELTRVLSDCGNKLVTLVSSSVRLKVQTKAHPKHKEGQFPSRLDKAAPTESPGKRVAPTIAKRPLGLLPTSSASSGGMPLTVVKGDLPDWSFLGVYVGGELSKQDILAAATDLGCEPGLIYAIARQESAHSSFVVLNGRTVPTILYERHWFRKLTKPSKATPSPFERDYPDICGPAYHLTRVNKRTVVKDGKNIVLKEVVDRTTGLPPVADDIYGSGGFHQYQRLAKAYQLDRSAALQACSWGKFQIMGFNYAAAGFGSVFDFVKAMSTGEPAHMKAFLRFAKCNPLLLEGLQKKDFEKIAAGHNGESWRSINPSYASNIEKFYKEYKP